MAVGAGGRVGLGVGTVAKGPRSVFTGGWAGGPGEGAGAGVASGRPWAPTSIVVLPETISWIKDYSRQGEKTKIKQNMSF